MSRLQRNQVGAARGRLDRNASSAFLIIDAQSVKNTDPAAFKGYDAGKKVSGIKRHIAVAVTTAEVTDRKGALLALTRCKPTLSRVQSLFANESTKWIANGFSLSILLSPILVGQMRIVTAHSCVGASPAAKERATLGQACRHAQAAHGLATRNALASAVAMTCCSRTTSCWNSAAPAAP